MNIFADVEARVIAALEALKKDGALPADLVIPQIDAEAPRDATHGDVAVNAALVLAKAAKMKPRDIADALKAKLALAPDVEKIDVAGPGFLNITFKPRSLARFGQDDHHRRRKIRQRVCEQGREGQSRIRVRQPDRADARRPLPGCCVRRCARQPVAVRRLST